MLRVGDWIFDPGTRRVCGRGAETRLSPKAAGVLQALAETPGHVWSRDALLERVWPNVIVTEEVLTHAIGELRRALHDDPRSPALIETIHKSGYRLLRPVNDVNPAEAGGVFDLDCYARYLEGAALFDRGQRSNTLTAASLFRRILADNPLFAPAHVGLAKAVTFLKAYYTMDALDLDEALTHCRAAKRIDPKLAEAYAVEGLVHAINGAFDRARAEFAWAIKLNPQSAETHYLFGRACFAELNVELAAPMLERAAALRSDDYHALMLAGKARQILGQEDLANRNFALTVMRTSPFIEAFPKDSRALCADARARLALGQTERAYQSLEKANAFGEPCYHVACALARAGEVNGALDSLEAVLDAGWKHSRWLERDTDFLEFRGNKRFEKIVRSVRGPESRSPRFHV
jgi:DNA-binding winged helix-turn-helix (wHTH) protein